MTVPNFITSIPHGWRMGDRSSHSGSSIRLSWRFRQQMTMCHRYYGTCCPKLSMPWFYFTAVPASNKNHKHKTQNPKAASVFPSDLRCNTSWGSITHRPYGSENIGSIFCCWHTDPTFINFGSWRHSSTISNSSWTAIRVVTHKWC